MSAINKLGKVGFRYRQTYSAVATYEAMDVVLYSSALYYAKDVNTGVTPTDNGTHWSLFLPAGSGGGGGGSYTLPTAAADTLGGIKVGANLKITDGVLSVDTATVVEADNTKPVTSAAVNTQVGNIEVLLAAI